MKRVLPIVLEFAVLALVAGFLALAFAGDHEGGSPIRDHLIAEGTEETGALNLVTAIYLGYRAFDTLGETIVLLLAVSGVLFLVDRNSRGHE